MMKKKVLYILLGIIAVLILAVVGGSFYMLDFSLNPEPNHGRDVKDSYARLYKNYPETKSWIDSLNRKKALKDTTIMAHDGDRHHAIYAFAKKPTNKVAVLVHGYTDSSVGMLMIAKIYYDKGYNVILPDLHAGGRSQGSAVQMGWKDRNDVSEWMTLASRLFVDSTGTVQMVVHGISMGAATTMCVAGEKTPTYVKCFVEDCGYTSVWDEFEYQLKEQFGLPSFPLMYTTSELCKMKYGWDFKEASPIGQIKRCYKPMLFIHGDKDTFVPYAMLDSLVNAKPGMKDIFIGKGSEHARSYMDHRKDYIRRVSMFVDRYIK